MKIYVDLVFSLNFFIDFIILYSVRCVLKYTTSLKRLFLGSFIGCLTLLLLFINFNNLEMIIYKLLVSILIIIITFGRENLIKNLIYFYLISIIIGGGIYLFDIGSTYKNSGLMFISSGSFLNIFSIIITSLIVVRIFIKENINYKNTISNIYLVKLFINNQMYAIRGFLDTGNNLEDPIKRRSVLIINKDIDIDFSNSSFLYVPFRALNFNGVIKCYRVDNIEINGIMFSNTLVGISNDLFDLGGVDCILPNKFKEEL